MSLFLNLEFFSWSWDYWISNIKPPMFVVLGKKFFWKEFSRKPSWKKVSIRTIRINVRIERFFGTLKEKLDHLKIVDSRHLIWHLKEFRFWYNHVRTHMNLDGKTPIEVWRGKGTKRHAEFYSAWDGLLQGYWHPLDGWRLMSKCVIKNWTFVRNVPLLDLSTDKLTLDSWIWGFCAWIFKIEGNFLRFLKFCNVQTWSLRHFC